MFCGKGKKVLLIFRRSKLLIEVIASFQSWKAVTLLLDDSLNGSGVAVASSTYKEQVAGKERKVEKIQNRSRQTSIHEFPKHQEELAGIEV